MKFINNMYASSKKSAEIGALYIVKSLSLGAESFILGIQ